MKKKYISNPTDNAQILKPYSQLIRQEYCNRLQLLVELYLSDQTHDALLRAIRLVIPRSFENYPKSMHEQLTFAKEKSKSIQGAEL